MYLSDAIFLLVDLPHEEGVRLFSLNYHFHVLVQHMVTIVLERCLYKAN